MVWQFIDDTPADVANWQNRDIDLRDTIGYVFHSTWNDYLITAADINLNAISYPEIQILTQQELNVRMHGMVHILVESCNRWFDGVLMEKSSEYYGGYHLLIRRDTRKVTN